MLSDFELQRLRAEKKRQEQAKSPAVEIAVKLAKANHTEKQVRKALSPFIDDTEPPEIVTKANTDPVRETLKAGGYITEG